MREKKKKVKMFSVCRIKPSKLLTSIKSLENNSRSSLFSLLLVNKQTQVDKKNKVSGEDNGVRPTVFMLSNSLKYESFCWMLSARSTSSDFKKQEKKNNIVNKKMMMFSTAKKQESAQKGTKPKEKTL